MSNNTSSELTKATFERDDPKNPGTLCRFEVQYNPKDFSYDKNVAWTPHKTIGPKDSALEFQTNVPAVMKMKLHFDTTVDQTDVRTEWVNHLLALTNPDTKPKKGEAQHLSKDRPPIVTFRWGKVTLVGVINDIKVRYLMFSRSGTPVRAEVSLQMTEWMIEEYTAESTLKYLPDSSAHRLVTVSPKQTITAVALDAGTDWRTIAEDNNIDDPLEDFIAGMALLLIA